MNSNNTPAASDARATTRPEHRTAPDALLRRLQWVAGIIDRAGPGTGPRLAWVTPSGSLRQHRLATHAPVVAGRETTADIHIDSDRASRRHFEISPEAGSFILRDLESRNGTRINGRRVLRRRLRDGDVIEAGRRMLVFLER